MNRNVAQLTGVREEIDARLRIYPGRDQAKDKKAEKIGGKNPFRRFRLFRTGPF